MSILSTIAANQILNNYHISDSCEIPIEQLVFAEGALLQEDDLKGSLGRIVFGSSSAIITISKEIKSLSQKRFVIAHELGHFKLHRNLEAYYNCNESAFLEWHKKGNHEAEANHFAAELLMPRNLFKEKCNGQKFSIELIKKLANDFSTSLSSTAIRYSEHGNNPIAVVFSQNKIVKWVRCSDDFPLQFITVNKPITTGSIAYEYYSKGTLPDKAELVDAIDWFPSDFNIDKYRKWKFHEQCIPFKSINGVLSFLWGF